ncbi:centromere-associated E isoform X3 [Solea senegalensis]|uniref:Centromere-associated protein E n=1 Tax=Solea senegalensis TaxID=28829 RepID=A0AAV6RV51_SOLSE|nr:centromere-associated E isoform X3 [Solea senegalensis]KAG7508112.1 centromere-associated E isoform X3 [Solea senegalensis]
MGEESAVKVCVRVRPLIAREESVPSEDAEPVQLFWKTDKKSVHQIDDGNTTKSFSFDRVFAAEETTNHLYQDIAKPLVVSTVEGYNGTIFAYGQTSSGKTFTMMGSDHIPGVIPLAVEDVFQTIKNCPKKEFLLRVSYMEIYNETVTDLLVDSWKRKPLEVREAIHKNIYVADLTEELVTSPAQALAWIRKGEKNRHYGKTKMNQRSSRSHAIFRMILESRERSEPGSGENADGAIIVSHLNLVDLAGSERASQTGAEGTRFKEGCNINRSLFTLGQVIKKLTDESQKGFTNYRDSKLTRILQNSLGGNAKTVIICTITPAALDETLSTLQFASTAKKMKNDPHVTEVSDDGALLKRYRNEIVDLKRRLQEVSSVTQTTVTEKEVLAHLLQEKDQLQREQEDRIRNLTRLMVTSSDLVPVKKMPKRRVTWGGKMVRLARPSLCGSGSSDLSFADPFTLKRKAGHSCLMEMTEDDEDFDVHWDVPDEPSDEMETTQGSVAVRSFEYSPKDASPDWMSDISQKVSNLELQLEMESQQKEEAMTKVTVLESRVSELQLQLQTEAQLKHEALGNMETAEKRAAEQELLQLTEAQQKLEAVEKVTMLDLRVVDLERQLESQSHALTENEQMRREFAETIQLLETLASEKDLAITERDYLRQELGLFIERIELLEKEKAALTQELEEKRETDEFKSLEDEFRKEHENELKNEMLSLKKAFESSEVKCLEFQNKVETLSEELKKKSEFAEELQSMSGKDLVQEVAKLRRSLDDAEGVSRDTKKEWAFLRSHNIALEEMNATFTANHKRMEAEVNSLHSQLEKEKSHSKNMQSDLQKELNIAFNENTKLTALLDGKVPKELIDSVELERTVTSLSKELTAARQEEEALRAQLQELASLQTLPHEMDNMVKQLEESEQQRALVVNRLKEMQQLMQEEKLADSEVSRNTEEDISRELQEQELQCVQAKKATEPMAAAQSSADETEKLLSTVAALSAERDQLKIDLQENIEMMIENQEELRTALEKIRELKEWIKQLETAQTSKQDASLTHVCPQLEALQKQVDDLQATLQLVNEQKHELERDLQHNMKMAAEVQSTLQPLQEQLQEQNQRNEDLERQSAERQAHLEQKITETESLLCCLQEELQEQKQKNSDLVKQRESDSQQQTKTLTEELENTRAERDTLLFEKENGCQLSSEKENLLCRVMSLSEERDQLQETLHTLRQEKQQLRAELEDKIEMMQCDFQLQLCSQPQSLKEEQEDQQHLQIQELEKQLEKTQEEVLQLRSDLQENVEQMIENQDELRASQEKVRVLQDQMNILRSHVSELESRTSSSGDAERLLQIQELQNQIKTLTEELENMKMERDHLLSERTTCCQSTPSESEETREKQQLGAELEDKTETLQSEVKTLTEKLQCSETERDDLRSEVEASCRSTSSDKEKLLCLSEERDHLQETLNTLRQEKQQLRAELEDKMETLQNEMAQLNTSLMTVTEQKNQLEDALQQIMDTASTTQEHLQSVQEELFEQKQKNADLQRVSEEKESALVQQIKTLAEKMEKIEAEQNEVSEEKEKLLYLSEERDQLQETLNTLRQEKQQLSAELEDKMETLQNEVKTLTEKLQCSETERDDLRSEVEASCRSASSDKEKLLCLSEERDHLQETLNTLRQEKQQLRAELEDKLETISAIEENLSKQDQSEREQKANLQQEVQQLGVKETLSSRLHDSTEQLQESFRGFKSFIDTCHCYSTTPRDRALSAQGSLKHLSSLPKATMDAYTTVCRLGLQTVHTLGNIIVCLQWHAQDYRDLFEELVQKDLAVFEEKRVQDVLLCRAQAPSLSLGDEDFHSLWGHRLTELLGKRLLYKQKMDNILERLWANIPPYPTELSAEVRARERFTEQLKATYSTQSLSFSELDTILNCELERRAALTHNKEMTLQSIKDEQRRVMEELSLLVAHANSQLKEERSKSSTLLQGLDGVPLKAELSLLKDNQQLVLQLQQMEKEVKTLKEQNVQLQEAQVEANSRVSKQKEATQLLQTELLDSRAHNHEKETTIQTLRNKLQQQEKKTPPSAAELEKLQTKMFQMEVELSSASDKHQQEIHRMNTVLKGKEDSLRKLKEILRSQQQGEGSFLKGEDLHTKLTNPRGLVIRSSFLQDKAKLEEEVKQLKLKITELESLVSTLHTEIGKWKSRAIKLKVKSKAEVDRPSSPCTPTKRCLPVTSESSTFLGSPKKFVVTPKKILESSRRAMESPNVTLPDSPKSRFFDVCGSLELLSTSCPKPFFDNSSLGTIPDADVGAAKKEEWWPQSPKQEDMCQTQ